MGRPFVYDAAMRAMLVVLVACHAQPSESPKARPENAMTCKADTDCPEQLICGPCASGTVLTSDNVHPECVVNPCAASIKTRCADGVCVVR
jgi:hypothetical protein